LTDLRSYQCLSRISIMFISLCFLRATAECFARLSHRRGFRPSVCHTAVLCQTNAS